MKLKSIVFAIGVLTITSCNHSPTDKGIYKKDIPPSKKRTTYADSVEKLYPSLKVEGGYPNPKDRQRQIVDKWYNFRFVIISSSCTVSPSAETIRHNEITDSIMTVRNGKNWYDKFSTSVDSLYTIDSLAIAITQTDRNIRYFMSTTEVHNDQYNYNPNLYCTAYPTPDSNLKVVTVEGYGVVYNKVGMLSYLRATIDLKKKKVINIDKTPYSIW